MTPDKEEYEALGWCHIHAQYAWHGDAHIEGTRAALVSIRDAIDKALTSGMDARASDLIAADGEGYQLEVSIRNHEYLEQQTLPYIAHYAGGVGAKEVENFCEEQLEHSEQMGEYYEVMNS